ncbi:MAG: cytochrome c [Bacteroidota bacterium]
MKKTTFTLLAITTLIIAACHSSKKSTTSTTAATTATVPATATAPTNTITAGPALPPKSKNGIFAPGNEELIAIQAKYKEVTMQTLTDGHAIYTGVCTNCHGAKSIYNRAEDRWKGIIDDMALEAKLTEVQKDAVYKYVLAIKATQPK